MDKKYTHLSYEERIVIRLRRKDGNSLREISKELSRAPSTVSRELCRNEQFAGTRVIYPVYAQKKANGRRRRAYRKPRLKSKRIQRYVERKLRVGWSPETISGRMKYLGWTETVSHEAIYQWIYHKRHDLRELLVRHHKRRKRFKQSKKFKQVPIPQRIPITKRPKYIEKRKDFGHWEADMIYSKQSTKSLQIAVERKSRFTKLSKLTDRTSYEFSKILVKRLKKLPSKARKTLTYDNGKENVAHTTVNKKLGTKSFFCAPYHSWEKGSVENAAGRVRRTLSKRTDFMRVSFQEVNLLERRLNNTPRKCLGFKTPAEVFRNECKSVALQC